MLQIKVLTVGEHQSNCYLVFHPETGRGVLIDPGDQAEDLLAWLQPVQVARILVTHGHPDHIGALAAVRSAIQVPVGVHPADRERFGIQADFALRSGDRIGVGSAHLEVVHIPGHTPGSVALRLQEAGQFRQAVVGDAIFPGGPGHTDTPEDLAASLEALRSTVFTWPDEVQLLPGHGLPTTVGAERAAFEAFVAGPLPAGLCGDVTWR